MIQLLFGLFLMALAAVMAFYGQQLARKGWDNMYSQPSVSIDRAATDSIKTTVGSGSSVNQTGVTAGIVNGNVTINAASTERPNKAAVSDSESVSAVPLASPGGKGGKAKASNGGVALGGSGGRSGLGPGGAGGDADAVGEGSMAIGGDGGDSGRSDGRGGKGGASPLKRLPPEVLKSLGLTGNEGYGQGGRGANSVEYDRRLKVLNSISAEYVAKNPEAQLEPMPGVLMPPVSWVNERLSQRRETFSVEFIDNGTDFLLHPSGEK